MGSIQRHSEAPCHPTMDHNKSLSVHECDSAGGESALPGTVRRVGRSVVSLEETRPRMTPVLMKVAIWLRGLTSTDEPSTAMLRLARLSSA